MTRVKLAAYITLRNTVIGLASGMVMGMLSGLGFGGMYTIVAGLVWGTAFGVVLGMVSGLLLGIVTAVFFYPLRQVRLYRAIAPTVGAVIAGSGAAMWGPWAFSSTSMTPSSAITIGLGSVLAALIAGWAGVLAAQNVVRWYERWEAEQTIADGRLSGAVSETVYSAVSLEIERRPKSALTATITSGWIGIALLAFAGSLGGYSPLRWLVCGTTATDVGAEFTCLPSPRLYTSVTAGFKATLPLVLAIVLVFVVLKKVIRRYRQ